MGATLSPLVIPAPEPGSRFFQRSAKGSGTPDQVRGDGCGWVITLKGA